MKWSILCAMCSALLMLTSAAASAAGPVSTLQGRDLDGNLATAEAYYDTDLNITWLADANYSQTSGFDADGRMSWSAANAWASALNLSGVVGWRLPSTVSGARDGWDEPTDSEMSHMYYLTLGNLGLYAPGVVHQYVYDFYSGEFIDVTPTQPGWGLANTGPFSNFVPNLYWSSTEYADEFRFTAYTLDLKQGGWLGIAGKVAPLYAWAVHDGDVGVALPTSAVPELPTAWLLGGGLLVLAGVARKRRH